MSHRIEDYTYLINPILKRFSYYSFEYDEIYQLALIAIHKAISRYNQDIGKIDNYIGKYILFEVRNYFRNQRKYELLNDFDNYCLEDNDYTYLNEEIKKLEKNERLVIIYKYYYQLSQTQIANRLLLSQATISRIEKHALESLRYSLS